MVSRFVASASLLTGTLAAFALASGCSSSKTSASGDRLCTPGAYVFCRCQSGAEGTKLCKDDGKSFEACGACPDDPTASNPGGSDEDAGKLPDDAGFEPVDSGPPPDSGLPPIDAKCAGKLVLLAGNDQDLDALAGVYKGNGAFDVSVSHGPALRSNAQIVTVGTSLIGVYASRYSLLVGAKFETTWSAPVSIGNAMSDATPTVTSLGTEAKLVYRGTDGAYYVGTCASGWDDATTPAEPTTPAPPTGRSAPSLAAVGSSLVYGFTTPDNALARVTSSGGSWGSPTNIANATTLTNAVPALTAMNGGKKDLLLVYAGSDLALHAVTRDAASKGWGTPELVDDAAQPDDTPAVAPMSNGRAMLVWKADNGKPFYSIFDPAQPKPWSAPAELVAGSNPTVKSTPAIAPSNCGAEIVVAYAEDGVGVSILRYSAGSWAGPYPVGGTSKAIYVGVGERP